MGGINMRVLHHSNGDHGDFVWSNGAENPLQEEKHGSVRWVDSVLDKKNSLLLHNPRDYLFNINKS